MTQTPATNSGYDKLSLRKVTYRSRPVEVSVEISDRAQTITTLEGPVQCKAGDAIVTGVIGERYPVPAGKFQQKFAPLLETKPNASGKYTKCIKVVQAAQLHESMSVPLDGDQGVLDGNPGDWCVWYSDTDVAIVAGNIFSNLYETDSVTVYIELSKDLTQEEKNSALGVIHSLDVALENTTIVYCEEFQHSTAEHPIWFRLVNSISGDTNIVPSVLEISIESFTFNGSGSSMINLLKKATGSEGVWGFTLRKLSSLLNLSEIGGKEDTGERIVSWHLAATEKFNANLKANWNGKFPHFVAKREESIEPSGLKKAWRFGAISDKLAGESQDKWQRLVLATTKELALEPLWKRLQSTPQTLIGLSLFAAIMLAAFSEFGSACDLTDPLGFEFCANNAWEHWAGPTFFFAYLIALGLAWIRYAMAKTKQWEIQHQDYRLLAECIRVLHVRTLLGQPTCPACDLPLAEHTDSGWVRLALQSIYHDACKAGLQIDQDTSKKASHALGSFIKDQIEYHEDTLIDRREKAVRRLTICSRFCFRFFVFVLLAITADVVSEVLLRKSILSPMMEHVALVCLVLGLGGWGGVRKVLETFALEQEIQRGNLVLSYLATAEKIGTSAAILESADYFLQDQAHWHALHRSKPIEAATGG
ncbi:hypothetical protein AEP_00644 [Curvibacter sp. AEP1-3]|uniref:PGDYG domain-containing protein n=1 Tax=Curvibacter sp. AEP1-3 TaxID=1844971 RepID=UPI000B3D157A|nr:PGDYG domain-containing protein [Curvibacter sp. AEP1-3]ARV17604.1 hypothetical protein AEP_00644 [Curvibacter sp. AEP1-3]